VLQLLLQQVHTYEGEGEEEEVSLQAVLVVLVVVVGLVVVFHWDEVVVEVLESVQLVDYYPYFIYYDDTMC
jgi:hypothetical protein